MRINVYRAWELVSDWLEPGLSKLRTNVCLNFMWQTCCTRDLSTKSLLSGFK